MGLSNFTTPPPAGPTGGAPVPPGLAQQLAGAPDPVLDLLIDDNARCAQMDHTPFRDAVVEQVMTVLIGSLKPNALLVGPAGVGKTRVVEEIARRIATDDPSVPDQLRATTIYELPISNLVAGAGVVGELESRVQAVIDYASDPGNHVTLFIDEIHQLADDSSPAHTKIAQILKPAMARGQLRLIGATTTQEARSLDDDPAFRRRFSRLVVDELTGPQTRQVLAGVRDRLEAHHQHQVSAPDAVLDEVIAIADEQMHTTSHRPDNALTLLDRAMAAKVLEHHRMVAAATAAGDTTMVAALSATGTIPLNGTGLARVATALVTGNAEAHQVDMATLRSRLAAEIVGQDDILDSLATRLEREQLGLYPRTTPIAWLFAGASGIGKTATARILAEEVTGSAPITLNLSEYSSPATVTRIIGSPPGYVGSTSNTELPFDALESDPHRLILLDEFEKACPAVQRLFLQVLDTGVLTTARGRVIDFSKTIIVATTNAARDALSRASVGFGVTTGQLTDQSMAAALSSVFDAELLGRFALTVGFHPIDRELYRDVVVNHYRRQRSAIVAARPRLAPVLPDSLPDVDLEAMVETTFVASQGARPATRAVRTWIEDQVMAARNAASPTGAPAGDLSSVPLALERS